MLPSDHSKQVFEWHVEPEAWQCRGGVVESGGEANCHPQHHILGRLDLIKAHVALDLLARAPCCLIADSQLETISPRSPGIHSMPTCALCQSRVTPESG